MVDKAVHNIRLDDEHIAFLESSADFVFSEMSVNREITFNNIKTLTVEPVAMIASFNSAF